MKFLNQLEIPVVPALPTGKAGNIVYYNGSFYIYTTLWSPIVTSATAVPTPPAGSTANIQFNTSGAFAADSNFSWDTTTRALRLDGVDTSILLAPITNTPTAPTTTTRVYSRSVAQHHVPHWQDAGGETAFAAASWNCTISNIASGGNANISATNCTVTTSGTITTPAPTSSNAKNSATRFNIASGALGGAITYVRINNLECWRGNAANLGGFFTVAVFGLSMAQSGMRAFVGLSDAATTNPTNVDPTTSTAIGKIGLAINSTTNNWSFVNNVASTAPTVTNLGASFPVNTTDLIELAMYSAPNGASIGYRVRNLTSLAVVSGSVSTNIPSTSTFLGRQIWASNNAIAAAVSVDCSRFYLETP